MTMRALARGLLADLAAGFRLALFLPVRRIAFRVGLPELLALFVVSALVQIGADALRYGEGATFSWYGLGNEVFSGGLLLATSAVLALFNRDRALATAIPVIVLASFPILQIANAMPWLRLGVPASAANAVDTALLVWIVAVLVRSVHVALEYRRVHRPFRAVAGGFLLAWPIFFAPAIGPVEPWFSPPAPGTLDAHAPSAASEPVLALQATLLDDALSSLEDGRPGVVDLYFVGVAGDATVDAFRPDVEAAREVMDERWGTADRSVVLSNNPDTLLTAPIASVSNLREALDEIGAAMDPDEDVAMVYVSARSDASGALSMRMPPLELVSITPAMLRAALDDSGIRYRVVVVSACRAAGFVEELADDDTAVIVASSSEGAPSGCEGGSVAAAFGEAFFRRGMAKAATLAEAFESARAEVEARERSGTFGTPSKPAMHLGPGVEAKLRDLRRRGGAAQVEARRRTSPVG